MTTSVLGHLYQAATPYVTPATVLGGTVAAVSGGAALQKVYDKLSPEAQRGIDMFIDCGGQAACVCVALLSGEEAFRRVSRGDVIGGGFFSVVSVAASARFDMTQRALSYCLSHVPSFVEHAFQYGLGLSGISAGYVALRYGCTRLAQPASGGDDIAGLVFNVIGLGLVAGGFGIGYYGFGTGKSETSATIRRRSRNNGYDSLTDRLILNTLTAGVFLSAAVVFGKYAISSGSLPGLPGQIRYAAAGTVSFAGVWAALEALAFGTGVSRKGDEAYGRSITGPLGVSLAGLSRYSGAASVSSVTAGNLSAAALNAGCSFVTGSLSMMLLAQTVGWQAGVKVVGRVLNGLEHQTRAAAGICYNQPALGLALSLAAGGFALMSLAR